MLFLCMLREIVGTETRPPSIMGLGYSWSDIKDCHLPMCDACMEAKMKAFPIPQSMSKHEYQPIEYVTVDILDETVESSRGNKYIALYADKATGKMMPILMHTKT